MERGVSDTTRLRQPAGRNRWRRARGLALRYERDPTRQDLFLQLAHAENEHADVWRDKLMKLISDFRWNLLLKTRLDQGWRNI